MRGMRNQGNMQKERNMKSLKIRNLILGEGLPKICVPLIGRSREQLIHVTRQSLNADADMYEVRGDYLENPCDTDGIFEMLKEVRTLIGNCPLVFTLRSEEEGGECTFSDGDYLNVNQAVIRSGLADIIDIEYAKGPEIISGLVSASHERGVFTLLSRHFTESMPSEDQILAVFLEMHAFPADILKFAALAENEKHMLNLFHASLAMRDEYGDRPFIAIAMGNKGILSRVGGGLFGSALTFARGTETSAPGQLEASAVRYIINLLQNS